MNTRGKREGICNICGTHAKLTEDHTPPKGVVLYKQVELHHIAQHLSEEGATGKHRRFQDGVKYRTLCATCNNGLGAHDDPALIEFARVVDGVLRSGKRWGAARLTPQNIMRSVIGHLAAQGVERYMKGPGTEVIAWYLTNRGVTLPSSIRIFWWPYPFSGQILVRDAAYLDIPSGHVFSMWLMKFYPLAFLVVFNCPRELKFYLHELSVYGDCDNNEKSLMEIDCRVIQHPHWPEAPSNTSAIVYGQEAAFAREARSVAPMTMVDENDTRSR